MRTIDGKFHIEGEQIIKSTNGAVVPADEPLFLMRARDHLAIPTIEHYLNLCELDGCNDWQLDGIRGWLERFKAWRDSHPEQMKQPGITKGL